VFKLFKRQGGKNVEEFGESKISKLSNYVEDNMIKEGADKQFRSFNLKLEKPVVNNDLSIMNADLANKNMEDMVVSDNFPIDIMERLFCCS
jgi:hypothetical protein